MCPSKLFIFDEFGGISTQLSAMPNTRTRCADSVVRSYHVYMDKWDPVIGDKFNAEIKVSIRHDQYTVAVKVNQDIVGHVPREISKVLLYFIKNGCMVEGEVRGKRQRSCVLEKVSWQLGTRWSLFTWSAYRMLCRFLWALVLE